MNDAGAGLYTGVLYAAAPILIPCAILRDLRRIGPEAVAHRMGKAEPPPPGEGPCVWFHAASMGETLAAVPVIRALQLLRSDIRLVISSITETGHSTAVTALPDAHAIYFPYDYPGMMRNALRSIRPQLCVVVEKELWPNFIRLSKSAGARVALSNGRMSDRTFRRARRFPVKLVFGEMLRCFDHLGMQESVDRERAVSLGAAPERTEILGNVKFDQTDPLPASAEEVSADLGFPADAPTMVAGSTHPVEDEAVLDAYLAVRKELPQARLIIAPRHLDRAPLLKEQIVKRGLAARYRTGGAGQDAPVFVLDTIGELRRVYCLGRVAFVGGSLVAVGGHDVLQPLCAARPVLFGPHTHNCKEVADAAIQAGAARRVTSGAELAAVVLELLRDPAAAEQMGRAGLQMIAANRGAAGRAAHALAALLPASPAKAPG